MQKKLLDQAIALGLTTQEELKAFELGYTLGCKDTYDKVIQDMEESINEDIDEAFPSFAEDAIERHEEKMKLTEEKERKADYSDQKEGE